MKKLAIVETHPVQYHAPVYRCLVQELGVDATVIYGSDFSVAGYQDREFGASFAWDTDLLSGTPHRFVSRVKDGGPGNYDQVSAGGLAKELAALAPDAVLALGYAHPYDRAALAWAKQQRKPLLFRGETSDNARQRSLWKSWLRDLVLRRLYHRSAALLYVGQHSRAHYQRLGVPDEKLFFSPYCVESATFQPTAVDRAAMREASRERLGIARDAIVMVFSGKLSTRKGVDLLPKAVRLLPADLQGRAHLLFLGDGALRKSVTADSEQEPKVKATFAGFQNQSALSAFYHAADLLVLPSRAMETWGLVVNEALIHGLPCVVSENVGSQPDLVIPGQTGAVCRCDDAASLARALEEVMRRLNEPGLADKCRAQVSGFTVRAAAEGVMRAWECVM